MCRVPGTARALGLDHSNQLLGAGVAGDELCATARPQRASARGTRRGEETIRWRVLGYRALDFRSSDEDLRHCDPTGVAGERTIDAADRNVDHRVSRDRADQPTGNTG